MFRLLRMSYTWIDDMEVSPGLVTWHKLVKLIIVRMVSDSGCRLFSYEMYSSARFLSEFLLL